jgi:hypothetical protein
MNKALGFEPISDRICKLRVKGKFYNMTQIYIYIYIYMPQQKIKKRKSKRNSARNYGELRIEYQNMT